VSAPTEPVRSTGGPPGSSPLAAVASPNLASSPRTTLSAFAAKVVHGFAVRGSWLEQDGVRPVVVKAISGTRVH